MDTTLDKSGKHTDATLDKSDLDMDTGSNLVHHQLQPTSDQVTSTGPMDNYVKPCSPGHGSADHDCQPHTDSDRCTSLHEDCSMFLSTDHCHDSQGQRVDATLDKSGLLHVTAGQRQFSDREEFHECRSTPLTLAVATSVLDEQLSVTTANVESQVLDQNVMELQSLGQRTATPVQQVSDTVLRSQGTVSQDSPAAFQSLDGRFGGKGGQVFTTGPSHPWSMVKAHNCGVDRELLHERFTCNRDSSALSGSATLPHSGTLDTGSSGCSLVTADRPPSFVTAWQDSNGIHASPSHGTDVCRRTMDQAIFSSIEASTGAQHRITDRTNTTDMDASTRGDGT